MKTLLAILLAFVLVLVGDSERRVVEADPDRAVQLETAEGGAAGYRFDFYRRGVTSQVYVQAGRVPGLQGPGRIHEIRHPTVAAADLLGLSHIRA